MSFEGDITEKFFGVSKKFSRTFTNYNFAESAPNQVLRSDSERSRQELSKSGLKTVFERLTGCFLNHEKINEWMLSLNFRCSISSARNPKWSTVFVGVKEHDFGIQIPEKTCPIERACLKVYPKSFWWKNLDVEHLLKNVETRTMLSWATLYIYISQVK